MTDKTKDKHEENSEFENEKFSPDSDGQLTSFQDVLTEGDINDIANDLTSDLKDCIIDPVSDFDDFINMIDADS